MEPHPPLLSFRLLCASAFLWLNPLPGTSLKTVYHSDAEAQRRQAEVCFSGAIITRSDDGYVGLRLRRANVSSQAQFKRGAWSVRQLTQTMRQSPETSVHRLNFRTGTDRVGQNLQVKILQLATAREVEHDQRTGREQSSNPLSDSNRHNSCVRLGNHARSYSHPKVDQSDH